MGSLILAVRFLTIIPVPGRERSGPGALGQAAWWFPAVGLGLGAALAALDRALALALPPLSSAVLVVTAWKLGTGGIHLDGLADSLDGLGGANAERRLAIMRDSRIGVFGAIGLIAYFLIQVSALADVPTPRRSAMLCLAPMVGRLAPLLLAPCFPAATARGSGARFLAAVPPLAGPANLIGALALALALLGPAGSALSAAAVGASFGWAAFATGRFGGLTGDSLGAAVELAELAFVVVGASFVHVRLL